MTWRWLRKRAVRAELLHFTKVYADKPLPAQPLDYYLQLSGWLSNAAGLTPAEKEAFFTVLDGR